MNRPILSASNFGAAVLCPGKPALETPFGDRPSEYAERGTNLHPYFKTDLPRDGLSAADQDLLQRADIHADAFIAQFLDTVGRAQDTPRVEEHEVDLSDFAMTHDGAVPGHPDYVVTWYDQSSEEHLPDVAILDLKSGMGDVDAAPDNWQLACYATLVWLRQPFRMCGVAIIQPDNFGPRVTTALYRAEQMPGVRASIDKGFRATLQMDAPRVPGEEQCRFCRAKAVCPEYQDGFQIVSAEKPLAVATLPNLELGQLKKIISRAEKLKDEVNAEMLRRVLAGEMPGWKTRSTGSTRVLTDPLRALYAIQKYLDDRGFTDMTAKAFDGCRKLVWGDVEELFQKLTGYTQKRAKETLKEVLAEVTVETPKTPAVVEDKK